MLMRSDSTKTKADEAMTESVESRTKTMLLKRTTRKNARTWSVDSSGCVTIHR